MTGSAILPGSALGVLGGGQLGRMFALAARQMGYRVHVLAPEPDGPAAGVADKVVQADYADHDALKEFARDVSVVTFEFENIPAQATEALERVVPVRPAGQVLHTTQNRLREKQFLKKSGLPLTDFLPVRSATEVTEAVRRLGAPCVLKTADWGYDGKGQTLIESETDIEKAWQSLGVPQGVLEKFVTFRREISVVGVRGLDGTFAMYGPIANQHRHHILDLSLCPADLDSKVTAEAYEMTRTVMTKLKVVGVLCVEFFLTENNEVLINELAPRTHNSGHLTIDAFITSQFEQQVRAICGLPMGSTRQLRPAAMANLLGDLWSDHEPSWEGALRFNDVKLHLYGKADPLPGRKMGHLTALAETVHKAAHRVLDARRSISRPDGPGGSGNIFAG